VRDLRTGARAVVKRIPLHSLREKEKEDAERECKLLSQLHHPNIVEYVDSFVEDGCLHLVTEYCELGDLARLVSEKKKEGAFFEEEQIVDWFIQIAMAVDYVHSMNVMHRDLKTGNVFLTKTNVIKLGDFGIAKILDSTMEQASTVVGTPYYLSPEVCESKPYSMKSDLWAMGCILYELCSLSRPFDASNLLGLVFKIVQESYPPIPEPYSEDLGLLIQSLLSKDPNKRPSCRRIFRMPFIRKRLEELAKAANLGDSPRQKKRQNPQALTTGAAPPIPPPLSGPPVQAPALTPSQVAKERRKAANKKREEELREATLRNLESLNVAKTRSKQFFAPSAENQLAQDSTSKTVDEEGRRKDSKSEQEEEMYSDDFEEEDDDDDDEEEEEVHKQQQKKDEQDAAKVLEECKRFAAPERLQDSGRWQSWNSSSNNHGEVTGPDWKAIAEKQRRRLKAELGKEKFDTLYSIFEHSSETKPLEKRKKLEELVGANKLHHCFDVEQLFFVERNLAS